MNDRAAVERWFLRRGIPHFIKDYSATSDVLTRALPALILVFIFEMLGAINLEWPWWLNVLAVAGGFAVLVVGWAGLNRLRGRPAFSLPDRVGLPEAIAFVVLPALVPLLLNNQPVSALVTAAANIVLLAVISFTVSYGLVPMTRWAGGRLIRQLGALGGLIGRALPLLLLFITFLFLTTEVWEVSAGLTGPFLALTIGFFFVLGTLFVVARIPGEVGQLSRFETWDQVAELVAGTPVEPLVATEREEDVPSPTLSTRQWSNVGLVVLFTQGLQILLVSVVMGVFLVAFGLLTVPNSLVAKWTGAAPHVIASLTMWGRTLQLTQELLRVCAVLSGFTGLYVAVYALTDATYRAAFFDEVVGEMREAFAVRAVYLTAIDEGSGSLAAK